MNKNINTKRDHFILKFTILILNMDIWFYLISIILLIIGIIYSMNTTGTHHKGVYKGYGTDLENIPTLLSRIRWVSHSRGRINYEARYIIYAFILTLMSGFISYNRIIPGKKFIQILVSMWLILISLHRFYEHHAEKFVHYCVDSNTKRIMKKLKVKKVKKLPTNRQCENPFGPAWNFKYFI